MLMFLGVWTDANYKWRCATGKQTYDKEKIKKICKTRGSLVSGGHL